MGQLQIKDLSIAYDNNVLVVEELNLVIPEGKITALVGANASGKSTILKTIARILSPKYGAVYLDGQSIHTQPTREVAKKMAILPQNPTCPGGLTVSELVSYGRFPHQKLMGNLSKEDIKAIDWALGITKMEALKDKCVDNLSGGQRQHAWITMALAQGTDVLLLDEPTTFLDMAHQLELLKLLEYLNKKEGRTIIMVLHDLNQASQFAHHMIVIKKGKVIENGCPSQVMTLKTLEDAFGIKADIISDPRRGALLCLPYDLVTSEEKTSEVTTLNCKEIC